MVIKVYVHKDKTPDYSRPESALASPWFWPKSEKFDFGQKGYHIKEHLKKNIMVQMSAS